MSAIKLSTPSSGSISLSPADTASNLTITVPAVTGTMLTNKTAGTVLQVVQSTYTTYASTSSTSLTSTGLTASITPSSSTSKILVLVNPNFAVTYSTANLASLQAQIVRGATSIFNEERAMALSAGLAATSVIYTSMALSMCVLDSPATTSSTTYTLNYAVNNASVNGRINDRNTTESTVGSTITLMEIAA